MSAEMKFHCPTKILSGPDCVKKNAAEFKKFGTRALVVTGSSSAKLNGSLDDSMAALSLNEQEAVLFEGVPANPGPECVYAGAARAKQEGCDFVLAIGGGSAIDAAKLIAMLAVSNIPEEDLMAGQTGGSCLPLVCVPTTAGTGSESTQYSILTNHESETKTGIASPLLFPRLALLDSKYLESAPRTVLAHTAVDSMSHSIEGLISARASDATDALASKGLRLISECIDGLIRGKLSSVQRDRLMTASTLGGMVIANTGTTALHAMGYSLTYYHGIDHGRANGILLPSWLDAVAKTKPELTYKVLEALRMRSTAELRQTLKEILGPSPVPEGFDPEKYAAKAMASKNIANCAAKPTLSEVIETFKTSFDEGNAAQESGRPAANGNSAPLASILPAETVRLIPYRFRDVPKGPTEVPLEIRLSENFKPGIPLPRAWDGRVFGYVRDNDELKKLFSGKMAEGYAHRRIYLNDMEENFRLTLESGSGEHESIFAVASSDVRTLLRNCRVQGEPQDLIE